MTLRSALRFLPVVALAALALAACGRSVAPAKFETNDITGVGWGGDFRLVNPEGSARSLADYRGKLVMLFFGYTNCPDACPTALAKMAQTVDRLGPDGRRVQGLFVTLDPARDTAEVLKRYVPAFHSSFVGLSADLNTIASTAKAFKVFYEAQKPDANGFYTVDHSSAIFVFDPSGRLRLFFGQQVGVDAMVHDVKLLLDQADAQDRAQAPTPNEAFAAK